jgi:UTP--glucose-1-phosphate uridylyltransferase
MSPHSKVVKAIIPAAGLGTRMLPATKALPKEMLPVAGKPLIQYAVEEAAASGIETVILVVRDRKSLIQAHFARDTALESFLERRDRSAAAQLIRRLSEIVDLRYVEQEQPLGLAHAIHCALPLVGEESFVVLLPDVIVTGDEPVARQLMGAHERHGGSIVAIRDVAMHEVDRHGIVQVENCAASAQSHSYRVTGLVEKPSAAKAPTRLGVFGRYLLEASIWNAIERTAHDEHGEIQLTDALNLLCQTSELYGFPFEGQHYDAGDPMGYLDANIQLSTRDPLLRQPLLAYLSHSHS